MKTIWRIWPVLWILFGLLNFRIMQKTDELSKNNPPFGIYWVKGRGSWVAIGSLIAGFFCLPFTIWAGYDCYKLSRKK